jgi:hypothetical protein
MIQLLLVLNLLFLISSCEPGSGKVTFSNLTNNSSASVPKNESWPFNLATDSTYTPSPLSSSGIELSGGVARLIAASQSDTATSCSLPSCNGNLFGGAYLDSTNGYFRLNTTSSNLEHDSSWTPAMSSLVGHWKMNNDWVDSINGNNGTAMNGATFSSSGFLGAASGIFDGADDFV